MNIAVLLASQVILSGISIPKVILLTAIEYMRTDEDEAAPEKNSLDVAESREIIEAWQEEKTKRGTARRAKQIKLFGEIYIIN